MPEPKKSLGQHWLHDGLALEAMLVGVRVEAGDVVLEIGPGLGTLTERLVKAEAEVVALEFDEELIPGLQKKFQEYPSSRFWVEQGDIRTYNFGNMPDDYKIVANIPYYLTANLMRILTDDRTHKPTQAALLVQKEVAERVAEKPGNMSFLAVLVQYHYDVQLGMVVPAELFTPPPKVDSQILILKQHLQPLFPDVDTKLFFRIVKSGFSERRKKLRSSLSGGLHITKPEAETLLRKADIDPDLRAQALSLEQWYALYKVYSNESRPSNQ
jgi:16S rRNA (adenine1518-N6/adenine1519-N6)-dimethyltransferase